jgi:lipoate-protein ligase A
LVAGAPGGAARRVRVLSVDRPALVLGSGQRAADIDEEAAARAGIDVVRRRSGGGAVLVDTATTVWVDLIIPTGDPLWQADVGRAAWWVGATWAAALAAVVGVGADVWQAGMRRSSWSGRVCFAGVGPGEVCMEGKKVVGVSQRRTREGVLFQTATLLRWDPGALLDLLRLEDAERAQGQTELASVAVGVGAGPARAGTLVDAFLKALP